MNESLRRIRTNKYSKGCGLMNTTSVYNEIQDALRHGERIVIATVVKTVGAAPCGVGSKILIHADGSISEGIAGPVTDGKIAQEALSALSEGH